jgi:hypothetical protein
VQVVGDDFLVTDAARVRAAAQAGTANAVLIKPNQRGTLTETLAAWDAAKAYGMGGIVSARSGETEDTTIVDLAVGWQVPQLKVGSFSRSERMAKWNALLRIEEALGGQARFAGRTPYSASALPPSPSVEQHVGVELVERDPEAELGDLDTLARAEVAGQRSPARRQCSMRTASVETRRIAPWSDSRAA